MKYNHYIDIDPFNEEDWDEIEPDDTFLAWLKINYPDENTWKDIKEINCRYQKLTDLIGIEKLINLRELSCSNNQLRELDVSKNIKLRILFCDNNQLIELDVNENLISLHCYNNQLTKLDVTKNINLKYLYCYSNRLTELDLRDIKLKDYSYRVQIMIGFIRTSIVVRKSRFPFRRFLKKIIIFEKNNFCIIKKIKSFVILIKWFILSPPENYEL